jgi:hypothetical protein
MADQVPKKGKKRKRMEEQGEFRSVVNSLSSEAENSISQLLPDKISSLTSFMKVNITASMSKNDLYI